MWTVFVSLTSPLWIREHLDTLWGVIVAQVFQLSPPPPTSTEEDDKEENFEHLLYLSVKEDET